MIKHNQIQISQPCVGEAEVQAIRDVINSGWLTQGPKVQQFEKAFCEFHSVEYGIAVTSCTTALHLALLSLGVGPEDEVIVPSFTWISSANAILYCGATPVFVDIDTDTFNIDIDQVLIKVTKKTKAVIAVHLFGLCVDIDSLKNALPNSIAIVEDAACAAGAKYKDRFAGSLGDIAAFSFHPRKSITTGEGGMITTNSAKYTEVINKLRNHGAELSTEMRHMGSKSYLLPEFNMLGYNYRMTDIQGAMGIVQLSKLEENIKQRQVFAKSYSEKLSQYDWIKTPHTPEIFRHAWQSYVIIIDENKSPMTRNMLMDFLEKKNITTRPGTHAIHMLSFYKKKLKLRDSDFPRSRICNDYSIALPMHNNLNITDINMVCQAIDEAVARSE